MVRSVRKRSWRRWLIGGLLIALLVLGGGIAVGSGSFVDRFVEPAPASPTNAPQVTLTTAEQEFYDFIAPRLSRISAESDELVRLAEERSRNVLELQTRGTRIDEGAQAIDEFTQEHGVPDLFLPAYNHYQVGIAAVRFGIDEARAGVLGFDWDRVASAVDQFTAGANDLARSWDSLQRAAGADTTEAATPEIIAQVG